MDAEMVGRLLAGQAKCEQQNDRISRELEAVQDQLGELVDTSREVVLDREKLAALELAQADDNEVRSQAKQTWRVLRFVGAAVVILVLPVVGWGGSWAFAHYRARGVELETQGRRLRATDHGLEVHTGSVGHEPLRARVGGVERQMVGVRTTLEEIQRAQRETRDEQRQAHDELRREIRRSRQ